MKFAICIYGQPRKYKEGYKLIKDFMDINKEHTFEIYFHCWIDDNIIFPYSPYRNIPIKDLQIEDSSIVTNDLLNLYKPIKYVFEKPIDNSKHDIKNIKDSLMYKNSPYVQKKNIFNFLSQIYSRNKVRNLLNESINNGNKNYDIIISTRFDGYCFPEKFYMDNIDLNHCNLSSKHLPRVVFPGDFIMAPTKLFLKWYNLYNNIIHIMNNKNLKNKIESYNEHYMFNIEEYLLLSYFYCDYNLENIVYNSS